MKNFLQYAKNRFLYNFLRFIIILLLGIVASNFLLINKVFAETVYGTDFIANLYDNNNGSLSSVTTTTSSSGWTGQVGFIANSSGAAWGFNLKSAMIEGHTYALSMDISTSNATGSDIVFSTYNRIGLGSSLNSAVSSYHNSTNTELLYTNNVNGILQFVFKATSNGSYLVVPFCTSYSINTERVYFVSYVIEDLGESSSVNQDSINSSLNNQTNEINNSITNSENNIKDSINSTEGNLKDSIINSENNIKDGIKEGFENCRDSYNLFDVSDTIGTSKNSDTGSFVISNVHATSLFKNGIDFLKPNTTYTVSTNVTLLSKPDSYTESQVYLFNLYKIGGPNSAFLYVHSWEEKWSWQINETKFLTTTFTTPSSLEGYRILSYTYYNKGPSGSFRYDNFMLVEGSVPKDYEPYGEKICSNRIDDTNNKLDTAENTRKGIWETIKSFPSTFSNFFKDLGDKIGNFFTNLLNGILDGLKSLFIPGDGFFKTWFSDFKTFIEDKLGFLATPFTIFIDFIESYSNLSSSNDIVINIPDISVPNFEDYKIISATKFNWSQTLKSKTSLLNLWNLYLDFIDVFLILNFIGLCEKTYNRIFGGDTSNYEYYTTEDTYNVDVNTGEVLSSKHKEKTTHRKKVDE